MLENNLTVTDILAAGLRFDFDYEKIKEEMLSLRPHWIYTPPYKVNLDVPLAGKVFMSESTEYYNKIDYKVDYYKENSETVTRELRGQHIFYLRRHKDNLTNTTKFAKIKDLDTDGWDWIPEYKSFIPYTIQCIEQIGYEKIGCIRVFVTENTFFPTHRDSNAGKEFHEISEDYERCLGLSLIPDTGNVPMLIYSKKDEQVCKVFGNAMLFNDSAFHGVQFTPGMRITIRIFGKIDFQRFEKHIDLSQVYYWK